jgi:hypothetical protein
MPILHKAFACAFVLTAAAIVAAAAWAVPLGQDPAPLMLLTPATPSEAEAQARFIQAHQSYQSAYSAGNVTGLTVSATVADTFIDPTQQLVPGADKPENLTIGEVPIQVDLENKSFKEVVTAIVQQAADHTGTWTVKWRLKPENIGLLDERVNLTAEAKFEDFINILTERIRNMNGIQLYFKTFEQARVVMITDTYY